MRVERDPAEGVLVATMVGVAAILGPVVVEEVAGLPTILLETAEVVAVELAVP